MKNFRFSPVLAGVIILVYGASCTNEPTPDRNSPTEIALSIELDMAEQATLNSRITSDRLREVESVWVGIEDEKGMLEGFPKMFDNFVLDGYTIQLEISNLPAGSYWFSKLWLEDAKGEVIYATPLEGSPLSSAVPDALPMPFEATESFESSLSTTSLSTKGHSPEDFGLDQEEVIFREELACDGGTFEGDIKLYSQKQIDNFGEFCYSKIKGNIWIMFSDGPLDLSPLNSIREIDGNLTIYMNPQLSSLRGFENLSKVSMILIEGNQSLISLDGLNHLKEVTSHVYLTDNPQLKHLHGLENLISIGNFIRIRKNPSLKDLSGLNSLKNCPRIQIFENENLLSIMDLEQWTDFKNIGLSNNPKLESFWGLFNQTEEIEILNLSNMELNNFESKFPANFRITASVQLENISGLKNLIDLPIVNDLSGKLYLSRNPDMVSLAGLEELHSIKDNLSIQNNPNLQSLSGLENLSAVGSTFSVQRNEKLTDFCALNGFFTSNPSYQPTISGNAYNPGINDFNNENCSQ